MARTQGARVQTEDDESSRRITACLAACRGIPTEKLEDGIILRLIAACVHVRDLRVREILEEFSGAAGRRPRPKRIVPVSGGRRKPVRAARPTSES